MKRCMHIVPYVPPVIDGEKRLYVSRRKPYPGIKLTQEEEDWLVSLRATLFNSEHNEHAKVEIPKDAAISLFKCRVSLGEKVCAAKFGYDPPDDYNEIAASWRASYEKAAAATPGVSIPPGLAHV